MLVLQRSRDESIVIGDDRTSFVQITPLEESKLRNCTDPALADLASRLLSTLGKPVEVCVVDIRCNHRVRTGVTAPKEIPVHRKEVFQTIQKERARKAS